MAVKKHVHKLKKHKYKNGNSIFFCMLPDCYFKVEAKLALGKECICHGCGEPFIMTEYSVKLIRPHCNGCGRREIKLEDGKKFYVRKREVSDAVFGTVAANDVESLRERLNNITKDDDI